MKDEKKTKPDCYKCEFRGDVAGSAHSSCEHPDAPDMSGTMFGLFAALGGPKPPPAQSEKMNVVGDPRGVAGGWFAWPANFEPVWLESCDGFTEKEVAKEA